MAIVECCRYCTLPSFLRVLYLPQCAVMHFLAILLLFFFGLTYRDIFTLDTFHFHLILIILFIIKYELLQLDARVNGIYLLYHIPHCIDTIQELAQNECNKQPSDNLLMLKLVCAHINTAFLLSSNSLYRKIDANIIANTYSQTLNAKTTAKKGRNSTKHTEHNYKTNFSYFHLQNTNKLRTNFLNLKGYILQWWHLYYAN